MIVPVDEADEDESLAANDGLPCSSSSSRSSKTGGGDRGDGRV